MLARPKGGKNAGGINENRWVVKSLAKWSTKNPKRYQNMMIVVKTLAKCFRKTEPNVPYDRRCVEGRVLPVLDRLVSSLAKRTTLDFFCGCACWWW
jgi:hypothetical protein